MVREHCGKRRNCSLRAISPFPTVFSKDLYCIHNWTDFYFTSIEKQVLTTYTNLFRFCFLGTTPVLAPNVWAIEKIPKLNLTRDLKIARPTLYLTTMDTNVSLALFTNIPTSNQKSFEKIEGKVENTGNQHFLLFPQSPLPYPL